MSVNIHFHDPVWKHVKFADDEFQNHLNNVFQQENQMKICWIVQKFTTNEINQLWQRFQSKIFQKKNNIWN